MKPTSEQIADCIDGAHDVLLVRGRCPDKLRDKNGGVCIIHALGISARAIVGNGVGWFRESCELKDAAADTFAAATGSYIVDFNEKRTDDEVFDALKNTAKGLREEAGAA